MFEFNSSCLLHVSNSMCSSSSGRPFVHVVFFYGIFLCVHVSSLRGGMMCLISRYCDLLKIKIFYVYIKLFRTITLTSAPSITNTRKRTLTSKYLCKYGSTSWLTFWRSRMKQSEHMTPLTSPQWFVAKYESRVWTGMHVTWTDI